MRKEEDQLKCIKQSVRNTSGGARARTLTNEGGRVPEGRQQVFVVRVLHRDALVLEHVVEVNRTGGAHVEDGRDSQVLQ